MYRRIIAVVLIITASLAVGSQRGEARGNPTLTVTAQGATMGFATLGMAPGTFTLQPGESRSWSLKRGTYVVVQAPPVDGGLRIVCSDGEMNQHRLRQGDDVRCTFTRTP